MSGEPRRVPVELAAKIKHLIAQFEEELIPHDPGTPCPLSVGIPMLTDCDFYVDASGTAMVCKHCLGCGEHCNCWDDDEDDWSDEPET